MKPPISLLVADDHAIMREALTHWLECTDDIRVVASVANAQDAVAQATSLQPNVVLMDIEMPGQDSFQAAQLIRERSPHTRIIFLSAYCTDRFIDAALAVRASGYLIKNESAAGVADGIRAVAAGRTRFSKAVLSRLAVDCDGIHLADSLSLSLTLREVELLRHIARGMSNKSIAEVAGLSLKTVGHHIENIMRKVDIHTRAGLVRFALQEGVAVS